MLFFVFPLQKGREAWLQTNGQLFAEGLRLDDAVVRRAHSFTGSLVEIRLDEKGCNAYGLPFECCVPLGIRMPRCIVTLTHDCIELTAACSPLRPTARLKAEHRGLRVHLLHLSARATEAAIVPHHLLFG